jgi:UDP-glucose 4-epimerase
VELVVKSALHVLEASFNETQILLRAAAKNSTPLLLTSTSEVYGKSAKPEFSEDDDLLIGPPNQSRWSYASAKLTDEFLALACAREKKLPVIIARLFNTVGPRQTGQYGMVLPRFIQAAKSGKTLRVFGDGRQTRCFCAVQDTVEALVRLQNCPAARGEVFNVGSTEEISMGRLAEMVIAILRSPSAIEFIPYEQACPPGFQDMLRRKPVVAKLSRYAGFKPGVALADIIQQTAAYGE